MPLGSLHHWAVIVPVGDRSNILSQSPSFERGTAGWGTIAGGTVGTTSAFQQFGAWSGSIAPTSNGTAGAVSPPFTAGAGTDYTASIYARGANGIPYRLAVADSAGINFVSGGTTTFTGGGTWQRYSVSWTEAAGATRTLVVTKNANADTSAFYLDGAMVEAGSLTSYFDGDSEGAYWLGLPHASPSTRSGTYRGGGSVIALADLGMKPHQFPGAGMPPMDVTSQSFAQRPGADYQSSRASERSFDITFQPISGTTQQDLHIVRARLIDAFKADLVDPDQPIRFWYTGGQGTVQIDAVYQSGLDLGEMDGPMAEHGAIKFIAHDPFWESTTDQGTSLAPRVNIGSANYILRRDPLGRWGTMGQSGTTFQNVSATGGVSDILGVNGTVFVCGSFGTAGGTKAPNIAMYFPQTNTWGSLGPGTIVQAGPLQKMAYSPWGSLYVGGFLQTTNGTNTRLIAQWNANGWGSVPGGTIGTSGAAWIQTMLFYAGTLYVAGLGMVSAAGTAGTAIFMWSRGSWGTLSGGSITGGNISALTAGKDKRIYMGGPFTGAAGTTANRVARWDGAAFGTLGSGMDQSVFALVTEPDGQIVAGGVFSVAGGGSAFCVADYNGQQWFSMGSGLMNTLNTAYVFDLFADQSTGDIYASGIFTHASGQRAPDSIARFNGYVWTALDVDITGTNGTFQAVEMLPDRSLYAGGTFAGTAQAAAVAQIVNSGRTTSYPTLKAWNNSAGTCRLYQLLNTLNGDSMYFNYILQPGETVTLDLMERTFMSDYQDNIFNAILPGSGWVRLKSGTNYISFFADNDSLQTSFYWRPQHHSIDGGTTY